MTDLENVLEINERKSTDKKTSVVLFVACFLVYACAYIARGNYSIVVNDMKTNGIISDNVAGLISGVYFACYAFGQFFNGLISDKKNPFYMVLIGVVLIVCSELFMALFYSSSFLLIIWWGLNGVGQSMLWAPIFSIIGTVLNKDLRYTFITIIALSTPGGKIAGYFVSGLALSIGKVWQSVFYAAALIMIIICAIWVSSFVILNKKIYFTDKNDKSEEKKVKNEGKSLWKTLLVSGTVILLPSLVVHGLFLNGALEWVPTILQKNYGVSKSLSSYIMIIIPAIGVTGVFLCNATYKKLNKDDMKCSVLFMGLSLVFVAILFFLSFFNGNLFGSIPECVIFVLVFGLMYTAQLCFNHILISLFPMRFTSLGFAASVSGLLNAVNYGGSAISTYGMSFIVDNYVVLFSIWVVALVVAIISLLFARKHVLNFSKENEGI